MLDSATAGVNGFILALSGGVFRSGISILRTRYPHTGNGYRASHGSALVRRRVQVYDCCCRQVRRKVTQKGFLQCVGSQTPVAPEPTSQNRLESPLAFDRPLTSARFGWYTPGRGVGNDGAADSEAAPQAKRPGQVDDLPGSLVQGRQGGRGTAERSGMDSSQLARIREQVRTGALTKLNKAFGRKPKDLEKSSCGRSCPAGGGLQRGLDREHAAAKQIRLGLMGAIRGTRLDPEVKLELVGAVMEAKGRSLASAVPANCSR